MGVSSLDYDRSGDRLALGFFDGTVEIRDASTGDIERSFGAGSVTVMDVVFSPDGRKCSRRAGRRGGPPVRPRRRDRPATARAPRPPAPRLGLAFSPDGKRLASAAPDGVVRVWALDLDELIAIAEDASSPRPLTDDECRQYRIDPCG